MRCDKNLLEVPPPGLYPAYNYSVDPPKADLSDTHSYMEVRKYVNPRQAKREFFMLCNLIMSLNEALRYYKQMACMEEANLNETYSVYTDPSNW
jgi:hypothetical protein